MSEQAKPKVLWQKDIRGCEYRVTEAAFPGFSRWGVETRSRGKWEQVGYMECAMVAAHLAKILGGGGETVTEYGEGEEVDAPVRLGWLGRIFGGRE